MFGLSKDGLPKIDPVAKKIVVGGGIEILRLLREQTTTKVPCKGTRYPQYGYRETISNIFKFNFFFSNFVI